MQHANKLIISVAHAYRAPPVRLPKVAYDDSSSAKGGQPNYNGGVGGVSFIVPDSGANNTPGEPEPMRASATGASAKPVPPAATRSLK